MGVQVMGRDYVVAGSAEGCVDDAADTSAAAAVFACSGMSLSLMDGLICSSTVRQQGKTRQTVSEGSVRGWSVTRRTFGGEIEEDGERSAVDEFGGGETEFVKERVRK